MRQRGTRSAHPARELEQGWETLNRKSPRCAISPELAAHQRCKMRAAYAILHGKIPLLVGQTTISVGYCRDFIYSLFFFQVRDRGGWGATRASTGCRTFPKRKARSIPSIRAGGLECSLSPRAKIECFSLNSRPFKAAFSGISRDLRSAGPGIFFVFNFEHFCGHAFRTSQQNNDYVR